MNENYYLLMSDSDLGNGWYHFFGLVNQTIKYITSKFKNQFGFLPAIEKVYYEIHILPKLYIAELDSNLRSETTFKLMANRAILN